MLNNYEDTSSGFTNSHVQTPASIPRSVETQKQQNIGPTWSYNSQLEGLYSCYQNEHQPVYNIHSMGHFEGNSKHNNNPYPQYSTGTIHQPVPTPIGKCHEACCQHLSDRYPINPAPLRYPPNGSVQPPRYGEISSNDHRQYFTERRPMQSSISRKKEFQSENGYSSGSHDRHFQYVGRGQIHVPESRQSMQMIRSQYPMYPLNSYWSPRNWSGPRMNYPPPPPYHQSVTNQTNQLQSNLKMTEPPHYIDPKVSTSLSSQQRRAIMRNANVNPEIVRPIPETKRTAGNGSHVQGCYDFPYHSGFLPFNEVNKMSSNGISSQVNSSSCKVPIEKQYQQHHSQFTLSNNERAVSSCNNPLGDIAYPYPHGEPYMRNSVNGLQQMTDSRKLSLQYEQQSLGKKRPELDVRQFLATWDDDEEDNTRMSEPLHNNNNLAPYIVVDCRSLEGEAAAKLQERLKGSSIQNCQSKPQNESPGSLNNIEPKGTGSDDIGLRDTDPQRSLIHSEYPSQSNYNTSIHTDSEKNLSFWNPENRENTTENDNMMGKGAFQPLDCTKRDNMNVVEPIVTSKRDSHLHGDMNHKLMNNDPSHMSFDALVTYYGDSRRVSDGSYDLVEMTERLVNASDKICTIERNTLEQDIPGEGLHPCDPRIQNQIGANQTTFHHRLPPRYPSNNYQHYKSGINNDTFFNFKYPVGSSKFFGFDSSNLDSANFDYHKAPPEFAHQKSFIPKDKIAENFHSNALSKNLDKIDLQDMERRGVMGPEVLKKQHLLNNYQIPEKSNLDFVGVDPEQFITPIIIKKSDYYNKENYSELKLSKNDVMGHVTNKTNFNEGNEKTVLMHSSNVETDIFKMSHSSNDKQVFHENNVVTLHSGDQTESNTVTVEVPYDEQYSSLVKLSEEITGSSRADSTKMQENNNSKESKLVKSKFDSKEKCEQIVLKKPTSFKLKRLPNSKEWIKIGGDVSLELRNAESKSTSEIEKNSTKSDIPKSTTVNLNMPSLDDIRFNEEPGNKNENSSSLSSIENKNNEEVPDFSKLPNNDSKNSSYKSDNSQLTQLAIVPPMKFPTKNEDESMKTLSLTDDLTVNQSKDNFDSNEKNFLSSDSQLSNHSVVASHSKELEINSQFSDMHSPYGNLMSSEHAHSPFVDLSSKLQNTSDPHTNEQSSANTVIDTFISESTNLEHNYSDVKKMQSVGYTSTNQCLDMNSEEMLCGGSTEHGGTKESFSPFHNYSDCEMNSHMSAYFKLNNRICDSDKDMETCMPSSPGVEEMFEDINHTNNNDNAFLEKSEEIEFLPRRDSPVIKSPCCRSETFASNTFNLHDSVDLQDSSEITLNTTNSCNSLNFNADKNDEIFSKSVQLNNNSKIENSSDSVKTLPAIPPINLKLNEQKKIWCIAKKPKDIEEKSAENEIIKTKESYSFDEMKLKEDQECSHSPSNLECDAAKNTPQNSNHYFESSPTCESVTDTNVDLGCLPDITVEENKNNYVSNLESEERTTVLNVDEKINTVTNEKEVKPIPVCSVSEDSETHDNSINNDSFLPSELSVESNSDFLGFAEVVQKDNENFSLGDEPLSKENEIKLFGSSTDMIGKNEIKQFSKNESIFPDLDKKSATFSEDSNVPETSELLTSRLPVNNTDEVNLDVIHQKNKDVAGKSQEDFPSMSDRDSKIKGDDSLTKPMNYLKESYTNLESGIEMSCDNNCNNSDTKINFSEEVNVSFTTPRIVTTNDVEENFSSDLSSLAEQKNSLQDYHLQPEIVTGNGVTATDKFISSESPQISVDDKYSNQKNIEPDNLTYQNNESSCVGKIDYQTTIEPDKNICECIDLNEMNSRNEDSTAVQGSDIEFPIAYKNEVCDIQNNVTCTNYSILSGEIKSVKVCKNLIFEKDETRRHVDYEGGSNQIEQTDKDKEMVETCGNLQKTINCQKDYSKFVTPTLEENNIVNSNADVTNELMSNKLKNDINKTFDDANQGQECCTKSINDLVEKEKNLETNIKKTEKSSLQQCNNQENNIEVNSCLTLEPVLDDKFENSNTDYKHIAEVESLDKLNKNYTQGAVSLNGSDLIKNFEQKSASNENFDTNESSRLVTEISEKNKLLINVIQEEDCLNTTSDLVERERNEINQKIEFLDDISNEKSCLKKSITRQNLEICYAFDTTGVDKILHSSKNNEIINNVVEYECSTESTEFNNSMDKLNENSQSLIIFNNSDEKHDENTSTAKIYRNLDTKDVIETPSEVEIVKGKTTLLAGDNKEYKQGDSISNMLQNSNLTHDQEKPQSILVLTDPLNSELVLNNEDIFGNDRSKNILNTEGETNQKIVQTSNLSAVSKDNTEGESKEMSIKENFVEGVSKDVETKSSIIKEHKFSKHIDESIEGKIIPLKEKYDEDNINEVENETSSIKENNLYHWDSERIGSDTSVKEYNFDKDDKRVEEELISVNRYCDGDVNKGVDSETSLIKEHSFDIDYHEGFEGVTTSNKVNICSQDENKEVENEALSIDVNLSKNSWSNKTFITKKDDIKEVNDFIKDQNCSIETAVHHLDEELHLAKDLRDQKEVEITELVVKTHYLNNDQKINSSTLTVGNCNHKDNELNITTLKRTTEIISDNENCEKITSDATGIAESVNDTSNKMKLEDSVKVYVEHVDICDRNEITSIDESPINLTTNKNNTLTHEVIDDVRQCYEGTEIEYSSEELNFGINYETGTSNKTNYFNSLTTADAFLDTDLKYDSGMKIQTINTELSDEKVSTEQTKIENCELFVEKIIICAEIKSNDFKDSAAPTNNQNKALSDHINQDDTANLNDCFKHEVILNDIREIESEENRHENIEVSVKSEKGKIVIDLPSDSDNEITGSEIQTEFTKIKETVYPINIKRKFTDLENDDVLKIKKIDKFCTKSDANILGSKNSKNSSFNVSSEDHLKSIQNMDINLSTEESVIRKQLNFVHTRNDIRTIKKKDSIWQKNESLTSSEELSSKPFDKNNIVVFQESVKNDCDENQELNKKNEIIKLNDKIGFENDASHLNCDSFKEVNKINDLKEEYNLRKSNLNDSNHKFEDNLVEKNQDCEVNLTPRQNQNDHVTDFCRGLNCNQERVSDDFEFNGIRSNSSGECKELQLNIISDFDSKNTKCEAGISEFKKPLKKKVIKNRSGKCNVKQRKYVPSSTSLSKDKKKNTINYKSFKNKEYKYDTVSENADEFVRHPDTLLFKIEKRENEICDPKGGEIEHHSQHGVQLNISENLTETNCNESFVSSPLENAISHVNPNANVCVYDLQTKIIAEQCQLERQDDGLEPFNNHSNSPILKLNFDKDTAKTVNKHVDAEFSDEEQSKHTININCCDEMIEKEQINYNIQTSYSINASDTSTIIEHNLSSILKSNTNDSPSEETVEKQMEAMHSSEFIHADEINTQIYVTSSLVSVESDVISSNLVNNVSTSEIEEGKELVIEDDNLIKTSQNEIKTKSTVANYNLKELTPTPSLTFDPIPAYKKHFPSNKEDPFVFITLDSDDNSCPTDTLINYKVQLNSTDLVQNNLHLSDFLNNTTKRDKECNTVLSNVSNLLTTTKHDKECNTDLSNESIMMDTTPFQCLVEAALAVETADANKMAIENSSRSCNEDSNSNVVSVIVEKEIHSINLWSKDGKVNIQDNSQKEECSEVFPINLHDNKDNHTFKNFFKPEKIDIGVVNVKKSKTKFRFPKPKYKLNAKSKQMKKNFTKSDLKLNTKDSSKRLKYLEKDILLDKDNRSEDLLASSTEQKSEIIIEKSNEDVIYPNILDDSLGTQNVSERAHSHEIAKKVKCNESEGDRLYFHVNSEKFGEYVSELNLGDIKIMAETEINEDVCLENETNVQNNLKLPNVELQTGTNLVIIIEELDTGETTGELLEQEINIQNVVTSCVNLEGNINEGVKEIPLEIIVAPTSSEQSTVVDNSFAIPELQKTDNNTFEVSNQTGYDDLNTNLSNDIANWPYVEEEVTHLDSLETDKDVIETNHLISSIKCSLPWERIFNIGNSKKRKVKRNKQMYPSNGLELGPAKIELRLASELGAWKVVNKNNDCVSPIVNVKRLILQRDPELANFSEKESEEEIDLKERRKSLSQSSDDSLPKVVIKKKNQTEYSSFIRIVDDIDDKKWQPVVALVRNKELDELCLKIRMDTNKQKSNNNISPNCKSNASNQNLNKVKKKITKTRKRSISKKDKLTENEDVQKSPEHEIAEEELFPHNTDREDDFSFTDCIDPAQEYVWRCLDNEEDWMDRSPLQNYSDQRSGKDSFDEDELAFSSNERRHSFNGNYSYVNENHPKRMPENGDIVETDYEDDKSKDWKHLQDSESTCSRKENVIDVTKNDFLQSLSFIFSKHRNRGVKRPSEGHSKEDTKRRRRQRIEKYPFHCRKCCIGFKTKV